MKQKLSSVLSAFLFFGLLPLTATGSSCWDIREVSEIDGFAQLKGLAVFSLKDSVTCEPVGNVSFELDGKTYQSSNDGYVVLSEKETSDFFDDLVPLKVSKKGYIDFEMKIPFTFGIPKYTKFLLSEKLPANSARFVLQWDKKPRDLDLHLKSNDYHISFRKKRNVPGKAKLDRDDVNGFGPETITLNKIEASKTYEIFVVNFSKEADFDEKGLVQVYINNRMFGSLSIRKGTGKSRNMGKIVNKEFIPNN